MQIMRGCLSPIDVPLWKIDECVYCEGKNQECKYCKGEGVVPVKRCPRALIRDFRLLPYFYEYRNSNFLQWPDGRGRLYQPKVLVEAFDIINFYFTKLQPQPDDGEDSPEEIEKKINYLQGKLRNAKKNSR